MGEEALITSGACGEGRACLVEEANFRQEKERRNRSLLLVLEFFIIPDFLKMSNERMNK